MRQVTINLATGSDGSVDPRVAPNGTIVRAENVRIDRQGRLVPRRGYTSLGTGVHGVGTGLVPFDLHHLDGDLVCLGNNSAATQTGIRAPYVYVGDLGGTRGEWRTELSGASADNTSALLTLPAADGLEVLYSSAGADDTDQVTSDCAATADGKYVCTVAFCGVGLGAFSNVVITETSTGRTTFSATSSGRNRRVLSINNIFYLFVQTTTTLTVQTINPATQNSIVAGATITAAMTSGGPYDVALFEGSTDYLVAFATGTGYTWRRYDSSNVQVTTASVVSLADAPVSICGASGETVSVANVRTATGVELRTFTTAGALSVGPTNLDTLARVYLWVGLCRVSSTQVFCAFFGTAPDSRAQASVATTAAHALTAQVAHFSRPVSKPYHEAGHVFVWEVLGQSTQRVYGMSSWGIRGFSNESTLHALAFDGAAKTTFNSTTQAYCCQLAAGAGSHRYVSLVTYDPRDKTWRPNTVAFELFSGKRRQGVASSGNLHLTGGVTTIFDRRISGGLGFESIPVVTGSAQFAGGSMTALGVYRYQLVFRFVWSNGDTMQSAPSDVATVTLAGGNNQTQITLSTSYTSLLSIVPLAQGITVYLDVYRTEAGGSIPRLIMSLDTGAPGSGWGPVFVFSDTNADSVVQAGAALYTQGADGSVSGRLPLTYASPSGLMMESDGKLILGKLERPTQMQISLENRPGETPGFVNDDLFYIQNPERIEALVAGEDGRRFIFGRSNIRELLGQGPNAAGVGDISEPVEIESRVGCVDWRSVCKTEHGVFFQSSNLGQPRIYLLPRGSGSAIDASEGVRELLELFPIITSATRHDEEQLLTFTLQNSAGTDGRIVHLDLKTSGMDPRRGWQGRWLVDRVPELEAAPFAEIIEERDLIIPFQALGAVTAPLPLGKRVGDRLVVFVSTQNLSAALTIPTGFTALGAVASAAGALRIYERILDATGAALTTLPAWTLSGGTTAIGVRMWLIRGSHASQAAEISIAATASTATPTTALLTPTWGAANTLWIGGIHGDGAFAFAGGQYNTVLRNPPTGFERFSRLVAGSGPANTSFESGFASRQLNAASQATSWPTAFAQVWVAALVAVRPLAVAGTPVRASTHYKGRLVVCNSTSVLQSDAAALVDLGSAAIGQEVELADIYPMGAGGNGRHLKIQLVGELLGLCTVTAYCSYDSGQTWVTQRQWVMSFSTGFAIGQTFTLPWVPLRRKIEKVRVKFVVGAFTGTFPEASPTGAGLAMMQAILWFEDLAGPARQSARQMAPTGGVT